MISFFPRPFFFKNHRTIDTLQVKNKLQGGSIVNRKKNIISSQNLTHIYFNYLEFIFDKEKVRLTQFSRNKFLKKKNRFKRTLKMI